MRSLLVFALLSSGLDGSTLSEGDAAFRLRENPKQALRAFQIYERLSSKNPSNIPMGWRLSMSSYFVGFRIAEKSEKRRFFWTGYEAGRKSAEQDPTCLDCHFWTAVNLALYGEDVGVLKMLFTLGEIRDHLKFVAEKDEDFLDGAALRVLGLIDQKLPGVLGGSNQRARDYFSRAISAGPKEPLNYLFLAQFLAEEEGPKAALEVTSQALKLPAPPLEKVESREALKEVVALHESLIKAPPPTIPIARPFPSRL